MEDEQLIKAFNIGYQMQEHEPKLLESLLRSDNKQSEYVQALAAGKQQREREKIIQQQQKIKDRSKQQKLKR